VITRRRIRSGFRYRRLRWLGVRGGRSRGLPCGSDLFSPAVGSRWLRNRDLCAVRRHGGLKLVHSGSEKRRLGRTEPTRTICPASPSSILLLPVRCVELRTLLQLDAYIRRAVGDLLRVEGLVLARWSAGVLLRCVDADDYDMDANSELPSMRTAGTAVGAGATACDTAYP
jgi:hypothetical protein